jgi:hypothetical protein
MIEVPAIPVVTKRNLAHATPIISLPLSCIIACTDGQPRSNERLIFYLKERRESVSYIHVQSADQRSSYVNQINFDLKVDLFDLIDVLYQFYGWRPLREVISTKSQLPTQLPNFTPPCLTQFLRH